MSTMGKEASLEGLEFDGETVLCRVCGDKASGFHYGVHACEGCKGFFRRSIQQKIQYRPCLKNQQCNIMRVNRNRCQYCRLKKCIAVGMSRDAVRFGRVPKKEKARIIEQMQKVNSQSQSSALYSMLQNEQDVVHAVINAHRQTCDLTLVRVCQMREHALQLSDYINCPANMACPLNNCLAHDPNANKSSLDDFSESFSPAIKSVVDFAKGIPGFTLLNQDDQVTLLKAGTFEVLLVRHACLFDLESNTMMFTGGRLFRRHPSTMTTSAGFLLDSMFDFAERFNKLCLTDEELALFSAVVLMSPDRPGLRSMEQVEKIQNKLTEALQNMINLSHKEDSTLFAKLLMKTTDLRTLNTLHSEKSIAQNSGSQFEPRECHNAEESDMEFQDSISTFSGRSSPTPSETSNMTLTSSDTCSLESGGLSVMPQRIPLEAASHQQVVLRTPYGTFYREEMSGFYGLVAEQPRRRCNTLDRDTLSRPRLHTIEEGNRRRYTLDREYINKMVNRLSDRLEKRTAIRGDSIPPSISSSAASSPIPEEYGAHGGADFIPISTAEDTVPGSRSSPIVHPEALMAQAYGSSPASPRPRSGSFGADEYQQRRRCYSFHLNSEGRASRVSMHQKMMTEREQVSPESFQYLSAEQRRGSVGAACGLHARKRPLVVDQPSSYVGHTADGLRHDSVESRIRNSAPSLKHLMPDPSLYGLPMAPQSTSPVMLHRRSMLPPSSLGISPPPFLSPINDKTPHHFEVPSSALGKLGEHNSVSSTITSIGSKEGCLGSSSDLRVPSNPSSRSTSRGGSPQQDLEGQSETFGHKKFDKFRKEKSQIASDEGGSGVKENVEEGLKGGRSVCKDGEGDNTLDQQAYPLKASPVTPPGSGSDGSGSESKAKRSAKEAHPNLLAHLNSPAQVSAKQKQHSTTAGLSSAAATSFSWQQQGPLSSFLGKDGTGGMRSSVPPSAIAAALATGLPQVSAADSKVEHKMIGSLADAGSKEQFHAVAVSHLKDKLMRKYDSIENLHKMAGNNNSSGSSTSSSCKQAGDCEMTGNSDGIADALSASAGAVPQSLAKPALTLPSTSSLSQNVPMLLQPGLHQSVYHPLLGAHYAGMPGLCLPPAPSSSQHLTGLQQQFAHMFAAAGMSSTTAMSSLPATACLTSLPGHMTTPGAGVAPTEQRSENAVPLNLTSKVENRSTATPPPVIPVSLISEASVKSEV